MFWTVVLILGSIVVPVAFVMGMIDGNKKNKERQNQTTRNNQFYQGEIHS